ncbi:MAG: DEAD/DEAH box helicase family protein [Marinagarivorans sp.]|nr:DEAD/DEAH box helicase family protein [Marinagarivorans sp.]
MALKLFDIQDEFISALYAEIRAGHSSVLGVAGCGFGKSICAARIAADALSRGKRVWFGVHLDVLVAQSLKEMAWALREFGVKSSLIGCVHNGHKANYERPFQIVAQATVAGRLERGEIAAEYWPDVVIGDEAHTLYFQSSWQSVLDCTKPKINIGLTGTPIRLSDRDTFADKFTGLALAPARDDLVAMGRLAPLRFIEVAELQSDFAADEKTLYDTPESLSKFIEHYKAQGEGGKAIAFCIDVEHAENVAAGFRAAGYVAESISYKTKRGRAGDQYPATKTRAAIIAAFEDGRIDLIAARDVLSVGFDVKDTMVALLLRRTESKAAHIQQIGRAGRAAEGKSYGIILDFVGNCLRHGYGDDLWERDKIFALPAEKDENAINPFAVPCQHCDPIKLIHVAQLICPHCGGEQIRDEPEDKLQHARSFDAHMLETVRPSTLDPANEQHAIQYFRYLQASAVLRHGSLPGRGWMQLRDHPDWTHWAYLIPKGRSIWTLGAIFNAPKSLEHARQYYSFLKGKLSNKADLSNADIERKVWYSLNQEFTAELIAMLRVDIAANFALGEAHPIGVDRHIKAPKLRPVEAPAW